MSSGYSLWQIRWEKTFSVRITGEPLDTETVTSGSEGGCWKSTLGNESNSLAAYPTSRTVLRGLGGGNTLWLPGDHTNPRYVAITPDTDIHSLKKKWCDDYCAFHDIDISETVEEEMDAPTIAEDTKLAKNQTNEF